MKRAAFASVLAAVFTAGAAHAAASPASVAIDQIAPSQAAAVYVASLTQTGAGNQPTVTQSGVGDKSATLVQVGSKNIASITQSGARLVFAGSQVGSGNQLTVSQDGLNAMASSEQLGDGNVATLTQTGATGALNTMGLSQTGSGNQATLMQQTGGGNLLSGTQIGSSNTLNVTQSGDNNSYGALQIGSHNSALVGQSGGQHGGLLQVGDNLTLPSIAQNGAGSYYVTQSYLGLAGVPTAAGLPAAPMVVSKGLIAPVPAALVLLLALQASPASVSVPQLSETQRGGAASVTADSPSLASTSTRARGELAAAPTQLGDPGRSAEASADLSTRAQGRAVNSAPVDGRDRCDPAYGASGTELCRRRLEARAGEFGTTGAAPVSAEARLLILSDPQPGPQSVDGMTRRLGATTGVDALAGSAANTLAGAIAGGRTDAPSTTGASTGAAGALPAGVPSTVLVTPH